MVTIYAHGQNKDITYVRSTTHLKAAETLENTQTLVLILTPPAATLIPSYVYMYCIYTRTTHSLCDLLHSLPLLVYNYIKQKRTKVCPHTHARMPTRTHARTHARTHTHTHTHAHHTHTHHTHTHTTHAHSNSPSPHSHSCGPVTAPPPHWAGQAPYRRAVGRGRHL